MCVVIHADLRALGYCNRGARAWFKRQDLDWPAFLKQGIEAERLLQCGDAMAEEAVNIAKQRMNTEE